MRRSADSEWEPMEPGAAETSDPFGEHDYVTDLIDAQDDEVRRMYSPHEPTTRRWWGALR